MKKTIPRTPKKLTALFDKVKMQSIKPFAEKPSTDRDLVKKKEELGASDLFSLFTANIIREEVIFTR